jgi:hypothetical protein
MASIKASLRKVTPLVLAFFWVSTFAHGAGRDNTLESQGAQEYARLFEQGWQWLALNTQNKKGLVCEITHWDSCIRQLNLVSQKKIALDHSQATAALARQEAMVLSLDDEQVSGLVLLAPSLVAALKTAVNLPSLDSEAVVYTQMSVSVNGAYYPMPLEQQAKLTLWHEIGHLENIALQGQSLPEHLSPYQHEWLADVYLVWQSCRSSKDVSLAWQQLHRRNMALINDIGNLSHWSVPQLQFILTSASPEDIQAFSQYSDFIADIYPKITQLDEIELREYSSLVQRTFGVGAVQALPSYMFWRQAQLAKWLRPTLSELMGPAQAQTWLKGQFSALQETR